jgi:hypothetical protein
MDDLWIYITDWLQYKAPFVHPRMGNDEFGRAKDKIVKEKDVHVEHPRPEADFVDHTTGPVLNLNQGG